MTLLGYLIDRPDLANVEAVTGFTIPKTLVRTHSFLGLVGLILDVLLVTFQLQLHLCIIYRERVLNLNFMKKN